MESRKPMDRLLCGDVGVGKTEVALRAAFRCVTDGYQVAFLVPTTILALQHYQTILERMEGTLAPVACLEQGHPLCPRMASCRTLPMWQGLDRVIRDYLDGFTLADLMYREDAGFDYMI